MCKGNVMRSKQQGMSITGLILVLIVLGLFAVLGIKLLPTYLEYRSVQDGIVRAKAGGGGAAQMREAYNKFADMNNVDAVRGRDLIIEQGSGNQEISFAYQKQISLTKRITLSIDYDGTTDPSGVVNILSAG